MANFKSLNLPEEKYTFERFNEFPQKIIINDIYTSDAYEIRFMIDNFNFCKLRFDCFDKNYVENKKMMFDEQENIDFNK